MSEQFTTGPWEYDGNGRVNAVEFRKPTGHILDDDSEYIGGLVALPYTCGDGTQEANARLIAAGPDLLDALKNLVGWRDLIKSLPSFPAKGALLEDLDDARDQIAKATGAQS